MQPAADMLTELEVSCEVRVVSAHRTPEQMITFDEGAADRGLKVVIAGAEGAAHLPGMIAATTHLPVIGVPVPLRHLDGLDSLLSIVQMPRGVPVATVSIGGGQNAGLLAARILTCADQALAMRLISLAEQLRTKATTADRAVADATGRRQSS